MENKATHNVESSNSDSKNVDWDVARLISFNSVTKLPSEEVSLSQAIGRTCAHDLIAEVDLPPAYTAMMDGYAVAGTGPWRIAGAVRAGQYEPAMELGTALRVSTGAHIPPVASFVIPFEDAVSFESDIASRVPIPVGKHIRVPGEEAKAGEVILMAGSLITPAGAGLAASSSIDQLAVTQMPSVDILVTGDELVSSGKAAPGSIRDSLSIQIPAWVTGLGAKVGQLTHVKDDHSETLQAINACQSPIIVTTGGTAHGEFDYVRKALVTLAADFLIDEIDMRPGHPSVLAKLPTGQIVACLPGNPLAALVAYLTLVAPALNKLLGQELQIGGMIPLKNEFSTDRTRIVPVSIDTGRAIPSEFRGSAMLRGLTSADALAVVSPGKNEYGTLVRLLNFPW
jgi:molybdopterin molybdotransferase